MGIANISEILAHFRARIAKDNPQRVYCIGEKVRWKLPHLNNNIRYTGEITRIFTGGSITYIVKFFYSGVEMPFEYDELESLLESTG